MWQVKMQMSPWAWLLVGLIIGWLAEWLIDLWFWRRRVEQRTARLQSELDTWRYRIHNYENATEKARADLESAQATNAELTHRAQAAESELRSAQQRLDAIRVENEALRAGPGLMPAELEEVRAALEAARAEVSSLRQNAGDGGDSQLELANARRELDAARNDLVRLRQELGQVQTLHAELDQARADLRELADLRRQLEAARERLAVVQGGSPADPGRPITSEVELEGLRAELQSATRAEMAVRADYKSLRDEMAGLQLRYEASENELRELRPRTAELDQLRGQVAQLRITAEAAERAAASSRAELEAVRRGGAAVDGGPRVAELEQRLKKLTAELQSAQREGAEAQRARSSAAAELEALRRERDELQGRVNASHLGEAQARATATALDDARRQLAQQLTRADAAEQQVALLQARVAEFDSSRDDGLPERLRASEAEVERLRAELESARSGQGRRPSAARRTSDGRDRLELINGIGRVYERKLYEAGVDTFAKLAQSAPEEITRIIQPKDWQKIEPEKWIQEAGRLAHQSAGNE